MSDTELNQKKNLLDCYQSLTFIEKSFIQLENHCSETLPMIDGFDLEHPDTYLELITPIRRQVKDIKFFASAAKDSLKKYRLEESRVSISLNKTSSLKSEKVQTKQSKPLTEIELLRNKVNRLEMIVSILIGIAIAQVFLFVWFG